MLNTVPRLLKFNDLFGSRSKEEEDNGDWPDLWVHCLPVSNIMTSSSKVLHSQTTVLTFDIREGAVNIYDSV